jgi:GNAT superfamily N-acetyltransferase
MRVREGFTMTLAAVPPTRDQSDAVGHDLSLGKITTRPSVAEDSAFMLELYASTSKKELDELGWSITDQRTFVIMQAQTEEWNRSRLYPGMDRLTICVDEMPVGRLLVCLRNNILHLVDLSLLPRYRGHGIGTQLVGEIIDEARNARVPVKVKVLKDTSAVRFVDRLGFGAPTDLGRYVEMTWMPPLTALGPDAREEGFASHGTRAHRSTAMDESVGEALDPGDEPDADVSAQAADPVGRTGTDAWSSTEAEPSDVDRDDHLDVESPIVPVDVTPENAADEAVRPQVDPPEVAVRPFEEGMHQDQSQDAGSEYAGSEYAGPEYAGSEYAGDVVAEQDTDLATVEAEEADDAAEEEVPDTTYEDTVAATDEFTANLTASFSAEIREEPVVEYPARSDRYDPFA